MIKTKSNTDVKITTEINAQNSLPDSFQFVSIDKQDQTDNHALSLDQIVARRWIERTKASILAQDKILYPKELQFDLAVTTAKKMLNELTSQSDRFEREYDEDGNIILSTFIPDMDEEANNFYIRTMSRNLKRYFLKPPTNNYAVKLLAAAAIRGLLLGQTKSGLTDEALDIALSWAKNGYTERDRRRILETIALNSNIVSKNGKKKCTHFAHHALESRIDATKIWMNTHVVSNGKTSFKLSDIGQSIKKRVSEMYAQTLGLQSQASAKRMQWASVVVTAPAVKHPSPKRGKNSWDGSTPAQTNKIFSLKFARVRAVLAKKSITLVGIWTREAHEDATPHVNYLIYFNEGEEDIVRHAFEMHFSHSARAIKWQIGQVDTYVNKHGEESKVASFSSYAMKYFLKFLNETPDAKTLEETAWATIWGIRRFGFFGLPSIQIWRRMRKSRDIIHNKKLEELRLACRNNDFAQFIRLCGGLGIKRSKRDFQTVRVNKIVVGVEYKASGVQHINKTLGEWSITKTDKTNPKNNVHGITGIAVNKVTVILNYPREAEKFENQGKYTLTEWENEDEIPTITKHSTQYNVITQNILIKTLSATEKSAEIAKARAERADEVLKFRNQEAICAQNLRMMQENAAQGPRRYRLSAGLH